MTLVHSITDLVGRTPLVRLNRLAPAGVDVYVKLESRNPAFSVKDRIAKAIVEAAEEAGELQPGGTIAEATSGNTGVALAMLGAARGYQVVLAMPESMSKERRALARAFGAKLLLTPPSEGMRGAVAAIDQYAAQHAGVVKARQFANAANLRAHRETTAVEIWEDTDGQVDIFVAGIGTGGTVSGVGQVLRERKPEVQIVAVEPADSPLLATGQAGLHKIQGIGANFVPEILDTEVFGEILHVSADDAFATARALAAQEGILGGISSGANVWAALQLAQRPESQGKTIVTVLTDTGERYISTPLWADLAE
ncbi:cysteine synthase A [Buchananella hordeovulneris]|uniref:cysteine synthase A n=1 Tax=Buchananella hordeovulneris TaxID=52770 RepID=UPI000F5FE878|nr:cysteine synthase A [Buchananella hordeovulneris]RRD53400.1 cysteine synthase A [Buchananella hordeovulneris]